MFKVGMYGLGAEDFGPPAPTVIQQSTQTVLDTVKGIERITGIPNSAYYIGVALIGYVAYNYMQGE